MTHASHQGLTASGVEESRRLHGPNLLTPPKRDPWWKLYFEKFDDPVMRILIIAAAVSVFVAAVEALAEAPSGTSPAGSLLDALLRGRFTESAGILIAILLATTLAFLNEYQAARDFDLLNKASDDIPIKVVREGNVTVIPRQELVRGDLLLLEAGEEVPGDGTLLESVSMMSDESRLTGESMPVCKSVTLEGIPTDEAHSAYPYNALLRGTIVVDGHGLLEVTAVGDASEIGRTARAASEKTQEITPLTRQTTRLSRVIGVFGFGASGLIFALLVARGAATGDVALTTGQWRFFGILALGVLVALSRVWMPIFNDAVRLLGVRKEPPRWTENGSVPGWAASVLGGGLLFGVALLAAQWCGWIPPGEAAWLPHDPAREILNYFMISVTIIVAAVPEGLPMSVTLSLAYSMKKMTATNNLVRRMHACETIGAATVICSDKTGTLTRNEMRVCDDGFPGIPEGSFSPAFPAARRIAESVAANSTAHLDFGDSEAPLPVGNPTEGALLLWLHEAGFDYKALRDGFRTGYQWTFSTERKFMGTAGVSGIDGEDVLFAKGAPEIIVERCATFLSGDGEVPIEGRIGAIEESIRTYQRRGMRTIGFALRTRPPRDPDLDLEDVAVGMTWLGFVAIADPVRDDVPGAVKACREAGVGVKIVTGDNPETAQEIARQIGLWTDADTPEHHVTGPAFEALTDAQVALVVHDLKILSRARPADKLRLVKALQAEGQVVAVTGDGTNDGPALNHADVGLAMGKTGTAVAKEASDIILLDDSFNSIVNAIRWGRAVYLNIQRFILFQLTISVAALGTSFIGPFLGVKIPFTVTQILWINLIMDTFAALALATEPPHAGIMRKKPRRPEEFIVSKPMARELFVTAGCFLALFVGGLLLMNSDGVVTPREHSIFFTGFVLLQFWNLFNARCFGLRHSAFTGLGKNGAFLLIAATILIGQSLVTQVGGAVFRTVPLAFADWAILLAATSVVLWAGELRRWLSRRGSTHRKAA
ncbi:MAG TPA: calcium-translocating P-type ATPase, PMCA-type [Candidatus Deferrimicrobiaceae bacterium]|jgi:Ca2+-transporting ATPase